MAPRQPAATTIRRWENERENRHPSILFRGLPQLTLQRKNAMARLKIFRVMLSVILVEELLIRLDSRGLLRKFIVTDRPNKPGSGLGRLQFGELIHGAERRGIIFMKEKSVGQIIQCLRVFRILFDHLPKDVNRREVIVHLDIHLSDPVGQLRVLGREPHGLRQGVSRLFPFFLIHVDAAAHFQGIRGGRGARISEVEFGQRLVKAIEIE